MCYQFCSEMYGLQEQMGVTRTFDMARRKNAQDLYHVVDVHELTESIEKL